MSKGFSAGVAARAVDAGSIGEIMANMRGFAPVSPAPEPATEQASAGPKHFTPAQPGTNPTAGWDMFDTAVEPEAPADVPDPVETLVEAARAEGYALGIAAGEAAARAASAADDEALRAIAAGVARLQPFDREALATVLNRTVTHLVRQMVGEVAVDPDRLEARVKAAAQLIGDSKEPAILRLHPADLALIEGRVPEPIFAIADAALARGALLLESRDALVEDGPDQWMAQLSAALDRVPLPATR